MDLSELYHTYDRIRKNQASPRQMLKIMVYAAMNGIFSSRDIETVCRRDINFMFLPEGMPAPDHATIARFLSLHLSACSKIDKLKEYTAKLHICGDRNSYPISNRRIMRYQRPGNIKRTSAAARTWLISARKTCTSAVMDEN